MQITAQRVTWSCVFVLAWLAVTAELGQMRAAVSRDGVLLRLAASAFCIAVNWAVGFAAAGVLYLSIVAGHAPWLALTVAVSFAL